MSFDRFKNEHVEQFLSYERCLELIDQCASSGGGGEAMDGTYENEIAIIFYDKDSPTGRQFTGTLTYPAPIFGIEFSVSASWSSSATLQAYFRYDIAYVNGKVIQGYGLAEDSSSWDATFGGNTRTIRLAESFEDFYNFCLSTEDRLLWDSYHHIELGLTSDDDRIRRLFESLVK
jgi:hypothetical protein